MATEEQKKNRQLKLVNSVIFGLAKGLYDILGDSALGIMAQVGKDTLSDMEKEMGLEIQGEDPAAILTEVGRILVDEYGLLSAFEIKSLGGTRVQVICKDCLFKPASLRLRDNGIPEHTCVPTAIITTALRNRLGARAKLAEIKVGEDQCVLIGDVGE
jgi:hypothetical protein